VTASNSSAVRNDALGGCGPASEPRLSRVFLDGRAEQPSPPLELRAGPLSLQFDDAGLRYIRLGRQEIVRRIYCAVRDENWGTVPAAISNLHADVRADSFDIKFDVRHVQGEIDVAWHGNIVGESNGSVAFSMEGIANSTFRKNRIGFCVLHPMELAGEAAQVVHADGTIEQTQFPRYIAPHNPFLDVVAMRHSARQSANVELKFDGDIFETEDQRNWIDASFKTFCTPLSRPFPVEVRAGERIVQRVTIELVGQQVKSAVPYPAGSEVTLELAMESVGSLPALGLGLAPDPVPLTPAELQRLRGLNPAHVRCELRLAGDFAPRLRHATATARELCAGLELALFVEFPADRELSALVQLVEELEAPVVRWTVFPEAGWSTSRELAQHAARHLRKYDQGIPIGGGTPANFRELNGDRPPIDALDFVAWSLTPQIHAFDNASLVETLAAHASVVESARQFAGDLPLVVGPIALKMQVNPYAAGPWPPPPAEGELPPQVDVRQMTLFGAGWTLGSIKYLAESQVQAATYYEILGWMGLMERDGGAPLPEPFAALGKGLFPLYHVLREVMSKPYDQVIPVRSSDPLRVDALALDNGPGANQVTRVLVANLSELAQTARIRTSATAAWTQSLDERSLTIASRTPHFFTSEQTFHPVTPDGLRINLLPYAIVCVCLANHHAKASHSK